MHKVKFFLVGICLLTYIAIGRIIQFLMANARPARRHAVLNKITLYLCKVLKAVGGLKLKIVGNKNVLGERGVFFISSHIGYLDGIVLGSLMETSYVAKSEILEMAVINHVVSICETIFIDSRKKSEIVKYNREMAKRLSEKTNVLIFPEGHSTDGDKILPFYSAYFDAPLKANAPIVPINLEFERIDGEPVKDHTVLSYYEPMSFFPHLLNLLKYKRIDVTVKIHNKIDTSTLSSNSQDRKFISDFCHDIMSAYKEQAYSIPTPTIPDQEKPPLEVNVK